jgi:hypothetical protein
VNRRTGRPTDDLAREEIHDDGEVEPALPRPNVGDIRHPGRVRPRDGETPLQQVGDQDRGFVDRPAPDAIAMKRPQMVLAHEPSDEVLTARLSRLTQVEENAGSAIDAVTGDEGGADETEQTGKRMSFEGTPEFAPPEQIVGTAPDVRSDIYSVGATLYFLLTARSPFEHANLDGLIAKIQTEPVKFSADLQSRISAGLAQLIRRCLAKQPSERPATYTDLKRELLKFSSDAVAPAPIGLRAVATTFDLVILFPIAGVVVSALVGSQVVRDPLVVVLVVVSVCVLYWSLLEGVFGASYGKRRCGLAVVKRNGDRPRIAEAADGGAGMDSSASRGPLETRPRTSKVSWSRVLVPKSAATGDERAEVPFDFGRPDHGDIVV